MRTTLALLTIAFCGGVTLPLNDITADSVLGQRLLSQARNLDQTVDSTWISGYSLKFQGCHSVQQWNANADNVDDVRIQAKRLIRFRLCPTNTCTASNAAGCASGYGDYVIDMSTFVNAYYEATTTANAQACESYTCDCDGADNQDYCEYDCYVKAGMSYCKEKNPYTGEATMTLASVQNYLSCARYNNRRRSLAQNNDKYFIGPYCASQGGSIYMGMFTDDSCSYFADEQNGLTTYQTLAGSTLAYGNTSLIGSDCLPCQDASSNTASEQCATIYKISGKCESSLTKGTTKYPNTNGCTYMAGIKITRKDGIITAAIGYKRNPVATSFIVIFAMAFLALLFYTWYLRRRLGKKRRGLL